MLVHILAACTAQPVVNNYYEYNTYTQAAPTDTGTSDDDSAGDDSAADTSSHDTATDTAAEEPTLADRVCASSILNEFTNEIPNTPAWPDDYSDYMYCYGRGYGYSDPYNGPSDSGIYSIFQNNPFGTCYWSTSVLGIPCPSGGCLQMYPMTYGNEYGVGTDFVLTVSAERVTFDLCDARTDTFEVAGYRVADGTTEFSQFVTVVSPGEGMCGEVSADFAEPVTQLLMFEDTMENDVYGIDNLLFEWDCE